MSSHGYASSTIQISFLCWPSLMQHLVSAWSANSCRWAVFSTCFTLNSNHRRMMKMPLPCKRCTSASDKDCALLSILPKPWTSYIRLNWKYLASALTRSTFWWELLISHFRVIANLCRCPVFLLRICCFSISQFVKQQTKAHTLTDFLSHSVQLWIYPPVATA